MPSRWDAATHGWSRRVFHYPLPTLMSRNFRLPRTIELQPLSLTPLKMRKVEVRNRRPVLLGYDLDEIAQAFMLADGDGEADIQFSADGDHGVGVEAAVGLGVFAHDVDGSERGGQDIFAVGGGWLVPALVFDGCWGRSFQSTDAFVEHQSCRDGFRFVHLAGFSYQCRHIGRGRLIWPHDFMSLS